MKVPNLHKLMEDQLKDLFSAENQLVKALPRMAKAASNKELQNAISAHLKETQKQVARLEQIAEFLEIKLNGKKCAGMEGLIEEGKEALEMEAPDDLIDLAIIAAAQKVEHYEISAYGTARALAEHLGLTDVAGLLEETLNEESTADETLTSISENDIMPEVSTDTQSADDDDGSSSTRGVAGTARSER